MNNSEFYAPKENWPQPPDDSCTLEPTELVAGTKKKEKKSTSQARKKLSESLAGVTAAAVAVVMLSATIPALKEPVEQSGTESCPVCQKEECPYFVWGYPGLRISLDSDYAEDEYDDFVTMQGFRDWNERYVDLSYPCVETEDERRCALRIERALWSQLNGSGLHSDGVGSARNTDLSFSGEFFNLEDEKSMSYGDFLYIVVAYDTTGRNRLVDPDTLRSDNSHIELDSRRPYNYITQQIPGVPDAQLQLVSSLDQGALNNLLDYCSVTVIEAKDQTFDLGKTMRFTESAAAYRTYGDIEYSSIGHYFKCFLDENRYNTHSLSFATPSKDYSISGGCQIIFSEAGWPQLFDLACELNEKAPKTGHLVYFPAIELDHYTINGITYRCYLFYHLRDKTSDDYSIVCLMAPQQESEVAIRFEHTLSEKEMEKLLASRDPEDAFLPGELLSQITLR